MARPDPRARELRGAVQPLEYAEQLLVVLHVESGPVVLHEIDHRRAGPAFLFAADLD
jgi:hypothetical protein